MPGHDSGTVLGARSPPSWRHSPQDRLGSLATILRLCAPADPGQVRRILVEDEIPAGVDYEELLSRPSELKVLDQLDDIDQLVRVNLQVTDIAGDDRGVQHPPGRVRWSKKAMPGEVEIQPVVRIGGFINLVQRVADRVTGRPA